MSKRAASYPPPAPAPTWAVNEVPAVWPLLPAASGDLPDINVWLALAIQEHPHHAAARRYWAELPPPAARGAGVWFCRVTMLGFVRLLCQPKVVGSGALDLPSAWRLYRQFRAQPQIGLLPEPASCEAELQAHAESAYPLPARLWTDAYLASVASASGLRFVSFDRDFQRFGLDRLLLLTPT